MTEVAIKKNWAPHPGEVIREEIDARGWSQRDLAYILGSSEQALNTILSGKRGISPEMAKAMGNAFDVPAEFFLNLQKSYELAQARDPDPGIAMRAKIQVHYPIREMIKRGWLSDTDASMLEAQVARFFGVSTLQEVPHLDHAAKKPNYETRPPEQLAWLFRVRQIAANIKVPAYSEKKLSASLSTLELLLPFRDEIATVPEIIGDCGVKFVVVEALPGSKIDGACFWLDDSPVIGLSTRHDRIDNFWFVLRHEIEHVLQGHGKQLEIVDADTMETQTRGSIAAEEQIANTAAANFCVPKRDIDSFIARKSPFFSERDILGFAKVKERHPGIVIGQIHAKTDRYELLRKYLVKIRTTLLQKCVFDGWGTIYPVTL